MNLPNSIELGVYPFVPQADLPETQEVIVTSSFGPVTVNVSGEPGKCPILTFHDIGQNAISNFENFFHFQTSNIFTQRFRIYNINAPGQKTDSTKLPENYHYPTVDGIAQIVSEVVSHFRIETFIGIGIGAGANIFLRYALNQSNKLNALILINATAQRAGWVEWAYQKWNIKSLRSNRMTQFVIDYLMWHHFGNHIEECNPDIVHQYHSFFRTHPNPYNLALFIEAFLNRTEIVLRDTKCTTDFLLNVPVLQIVGINSAFVHDSVYLNSQLNPKHTEWLKIADSSGLVLDDKPLEVAQAVFLFLQGFGFYPDINVLKMINAVKEEQLNGGMRRGPDEMEARIDEE